MAGLLEGGAGGVERGGLARPRNPDHHRHTWKHIDFDKRRVTIARSIAEIGGELVEKDAKTHQVLPRAAMASRSGGWRAINVPLHVPSEVPLHLPFCDFSRR
ncbi:MAG: hypothetical protein AMXMBFR46_28270 [Acidimicrobiia bacterium]